MNLYQPVFVSYIDAKAGTVMSVTRGNLSHTEMKICEPVGVLQSCVLWENPPKQYMTNEAQILTVSHAIFKHLSLVKTFLNNSRQSLYDDGHIHGDGLQPEARVPWKPWRRRWTTAAVRGTGEERFNDYLFFQIFLSFVKDTIIMITISLIMIRWTTSGGTVS